MALVNSSKVIIGLTSAGVIGGASAGIYYLNNSKEELSSQQQKQEEIDNKVSSKLSKFGYLVLKTNNKDDDNNWQTLLSEYQKVKQEADLHKFTDETIDGLKKECKTILDSENNYLFAKRFCVMGETIDTMLKRNHYTKLGKNTESADKAKWDRKLNSIKGNQKAIQEMNLTFKNNNGDSALLVTACTKIETNNKKTYEDKDFEKNYNNAKNWCYLGRDEK